jgi:peptidoglycan/xylan/chitin deacetylase (PgdA/CDA1 family)
LYCDWEKRDSTLVSYSTFETDLKANFAELNKFGIGPADAPFFMPPYEWYNQEIVKWSHKLGFDVINFSPGTGTNADYTTPEMKNYKSSEQLITNLNQLEVKSKNGLNGSILLIHPGTEMKRTDKLYLQLEEIIDFYISKGYQFKSLKPENG